MPMLCDPSDAPRTSVALLADELSADVLRSTDLAVWTSVDVPSDLAVIPARQVLADPSGRDRREISQSCDPIGRYLDLPDHRCLWLELTSHFGRFVHRQVCLVNHDGSG